MNIIEQVFNTLGRAKAQYLKGFESITEVKSDSIPNPFSTSWTNASINDPSAWLDPTFWGTALLEGRKPQTKAEFVAAFTSWVYICVKLNAQTVASVPLRLYVAKKRKGQKFKTVETRGVSQARLKWLYSNESLDPWLTKAEEIEEVTEHPFLDVMREINPWNNRRDLWESSSMFLDLTGECYWYLPPSKLGVPQQIWVIPAQYVNPKFGKSLGIEYFEYRRGGAEVKIPPEQIIMFSYPNPNNIFTGYACVRGVADAIYLQKQMYEFETSLFENRARPGGILMPKSRMTDADRKRLTEQFSQKFAGAKKAGKTLIPPADMEFIRDAMTPEEISFIAGMKLYRTEIMASLDIPEGAIITESSNRAVAEAADYRHAKNGILPRCKRLEEKVNEKLVPRYDEKLFVAFDDCVPKNRELMLKESTELVGAGIKTINQDRTERGWEPVEGGDRPLIDSRRIPLGAGSEEEQVKQFTQRVVDAMKEILG